MKKYFAELFGTMVLVLMGCGAAVFAGAPQPFFSVGTLGVALAFGLSVVVMAYAIGSISGCHINPAITLGMWLTRRISGRDAGMYMLFQVIGAIIGSAILFTLAWDSGTSTTFTGANGYAMVWPAFVAETVFTLIFVFVALGATSPRANKRFAGLAIGLALALVHIVCIPITGTSVNPARSIGPAIFEGGHALGQLWLFIVAPLAGAVLAALLWRAIGSEVPDGRKGSVSVKYTQVNVLPAMPVPVPVVEAVIAEKPAASAKAKPRRRSAASRKPAAAPAKVVSEATKTRARRK